MNCAALTLKILVPSGYFTVFEQFSMLFLSGTARLHHDKGCGRYSKTRHDTLGTESVRLPTQMCFLFEGRFAPSDPGMLINSTSHHFLPQRNMAHLQWRMLHCDRDIFQTGEALHFDKVVMRTESSAYNFVYLKIGRTSQKQLWALYISHLFLLTLPISGARPGGSHASGRGTSGPVTSSAFQPRRWVSQHIWGRLSVALHLNMMEGHGNIFTNVN